MDMPTTALDVKGQLQFSEAEILSAHLLKEKLIEQDEFQHLMQALVRRAKCPYMTRASYEVICHDIH